MMIERNREFHYVFQITKLIMFEVDYYTVGSNSQPYFGTSANQFYKNKSGYTQGGQAQEDLLPHASAAYKFYKKWDSKHLCALTPEEMDNLEKDLKILKNTYNYLEWRMTDENKNSAIRSNGFSFYSTVEFSKQKLKKF